MRHTHAGKHGIRPDMFTNHVVYIDDFGSGVAEAVKYNHWTIDEGTVSSGVNGPYGNWVDKPVAGVRHYYIANYGNPNITEYDVQGNLLFTYNAGISDSIGVSTDKNGNVYEADYNPSITGGGYVNEYRQRSNIVLATCSPGGAVEGVAVDKHGNVFVDYNNTTGSANIIEYVHGLTASGCAGTVLPVTLGFAGGMVLDKQGRLVVCDQVGTGSGAVVDIIAPPYTAITGTLGSGWIDPFHVTVDMAGTRAYVTDNAAADVEVLNYPSNSLITMINSTSTSGIVDPSSAVDKHNLVVDNQGP